MKRLMQHTLYQPFYYYAEIISRNLSSFTGFEK